MSTYLEYQHSTMPEWEFLTAVVERADCGILLDINNIFVSAFNHGFSAEEYLQAVPVRRGHQFHLAGHSDKGTFLHDIHDHPIVDPVWNLYAQAVQRFGQVSTLIEWDDHIPPFAAVHAEALHAKAIYGSVHHAHSDARTDAAPVLETDYRA